MLFPNKPFAWNCERQSCIRSFLYERSYPLPEGHPGSLTNLANNAYLPTLYSYINPPCFQPAQPCRRMGRVFVVDHRFVLGCHPGFNAFYERPTQDLLNQHKGPHQGLLDAGWCVPLVQTHTLTPLFPLTAI
jgi:hypothetical protein